MITDIIGDETSRLNCILRKEDRIIHKKSQERRSRNLCSVKLLIYALTPIFGDSVSPGQLIGTVGSTGHSSGPHLHFQLRPLGGGQWQDPLIYVQPPR